MWTSESALTATTGIYYACRRSPKQANCSSGANCVGGIWGKGTSRSLCI
ncbi:MAG: hypothetical protein ACLRMJ_09960 [Alistipes finegoldii]